jgi:hypothetical protein
MACTPSTFVVWEGSHNVAIAREDKGTSFRQLNHDELFALEDTCKKVALLAEPGDILVMIGGWLVRSSPSVPNGGPEC